MRLEIRNAFELGVFRSLLTTADVAAARANLENDLRRGRVMRTTVWVAGGVSFGRPDERATFGDDSEEKLLLAIGKYDVYWVQDYNHRDKPLRLARNVEVRENELAVVSANSGIELKVPPNTLALDADYGWGGWCRSAVSQRGRSICRKANSTGHCWFPPAPTTSYGSRTISTNRKR
jgi:hypothetical protein